MLIRFEPALPDEFFLFLISLWFPFSLSCSLFLPETAIPEAEGRSDSSILALTSPVCEKQRWNLQPENWFHFLSLCFNFGEKKCLCCLYRTAFHEFTKTIKTKKLTLEGAPGAVWSCPVDFGYLHRGTWSLVMIFPIWLDFPNFQLGQLPLFHCLAALKWLCLCWWGRRSLLFSVNHLDWSPRHKKSLQIKLFFLNFSN